MVFVPQYLRSQFDMSSGPGALRLESFRIISQVSPGVKKVMDS